MLADVFAFKRHRYSTATQEIAGDFEFEKDTKKCIDLLLYLGNDEIASQGSQIKCLTVAFIVRQSILYCSLTLLFGNFSYFLFKSCAEFTARHIKGHGK